MLPEKYREFSYITSSNVKNLYNHGTINKTKKLTLV